MFVLWFPFPPTILLVSPRSQPGETKFFRNRMVFIDIKKFSHYNTRYPVLIHTFHATIIHLMKKNDIKGRVTRWLLLLKRFDLTILDNPGKHIVFANFLSLLTNITNHNDIDDNFPNGKLF